MLKCIVLVSALVTCGFVHVRCLPAELSKYAILRYNFENCTSKTVVDTSGNRNNAVATKNLTCDKGRCGHALCFDNNQRLNIKLVDKRGETGSLTNLTVAVWIWTNVSKVNQTRMIFNSFETEKSTKPLLHFGLKKDGGVRWYMKSCKGNEKIFNVALQQSLLPMRWHHVAVTYKYLNGQLGELLTTLPSGFADNGTGAHTWSLIIVHSPRENTGITPTTGTHRGSIFVNGTKRNTTDTKNNCTRNLPDRLGLSPSIGSRRNKKWFLGRMDDYHIFNKALNGTELEQVMKLCYPEGSTSEASPATTTPSSKQTTVATVMTSSTTPPKKQFTVATNMNSTAMTPTEQPIEEPQMGTTTTPSTEQSTTATEVNSTATPPTEQSTVATKVKNISTTPTKEVYGISADLQKAANIKNQSEAKEFLSQIIDRNTPRNVSVTGENNSDDAGVMTFTKNLEKIGLFLGRNVLRKNQSLTLETSSIFMMMLVPPSGFKFPSEVEASSNESMAFPDEIVETDNSVPRVVVCMSYANLHENLQETVTVSSTSLQPNVTLKLNSKIIGAAVDPPLARPLNNPIEISFVHEPVSNGKQVCSFWNHSVRVANGSTGQWSTHGCHVDEQKSTPTKTVCLCDHLTNFALLLQREGTPYRQASISLKIITIFGCSLSIIAFFLCFIMFLTFKKKDIRHYLHINLSVAIAIAQLIIVFGITETKYKGICKTLAVALHYFYLVAFLLMLSEGIHLAILIETAFKYGDLKLPVYLIASWGLPFLIVGITLAARFNSYGGDTACFISPGEGTVYAFVAPFGLILVVNFVVLAIVLRHVVRKTSLPIATKTATKFEIARATVRSLVILFPVMGFTWIFGLLFFAFQSLALEYLFGIFCSLQGFLIFLFQYLLNTETRSAFLRATQRWRTSTTSSFFSRNESGRGAMKASPPSPEEQDQLKSSKQNNCHLLVCRTADENNASTMDTRTVSSFL